VLRRGDDVPGRSVHDEDAALGRGLDVHVVEADARAPDDAQLLARGQELLVDLRSRPHNERVVVSDRREEGLARQVGLDVGGEPRRPQDGEARFREGLGNENAGGHAGTGALARSAATASSWALR
jgi:hypothetical protein